MKSLIEQLQPLLHTSEAHQIHQKAIIWLIEQYIERKEYGTVSTELMTAFNQLFRQCAHCRGYYYFHNASIREIAKQQAEIGFDAQRFKENQQAFAQDLNDYLQKEQAASLPKTIQPHLETIKQSIQQSIGWSKDSLAEIFKYYKLPTTNMAFRSSAEITKMEQDPKQAYLDWFDLQMREQGKNWYPIKIKVIKQRIIVFLRCLELDDYTDKTPPQIELISPSLSINNKIKSTKKWFSVEISGLEQGKTIEQLVIHEQGENQLSFEFFIK